MGMFDIVKHKMKCPKCGRIIRDFQSKSDLCMLRELDFWEVDNFYAHCECGVWIIFTLRNEFFPKRPKYVIGQYKMTVELPKKPE